MARDRHRVPEAERIALADVVDVGEVGRELHFLQEVVLARVVEEVLELEVAVEVVLDRALVAAGDDQDVGEPGLHGLFDDVLDRGLVDDRQHLLGRALRRRQEARAQAGGGDHRLAHPCHPLPPQAARGRTPEIDLLAPEQPADVRRVADDDQQRERRRRHRLPIGRSRATRYSDREENRGEQRRERRLVQHPRDDEPDARRGRRRSAGTARRARRPRPPRPCRPCGRAGYVWPTTAATPSTHAPGPAADRHARARPRSRPWRSRAAARARPALQPSSRATFEAPGLPEPSSRMSRPCARATSRALGNVPSSQATGTRSAMATMPAHSGPTANDRARSTALGVIRAGTIGTRRRRVPIPGDRSDGVVHADIRVPLRQVRRADRGVPDVRRRAAHQARRLRRQADQGPVGGRHRPEGLGFYKTDNRSVVEGRARKERSKESTSSSSVVRLRVVELELRLAVVGFRLVELVESSDSGSSKLVGLVGSGSSSGSEAKSA